MLILSLYLPQVVPQEPEEPKVPLSEASSAVSEIVTFNAGDADAPRGGTGRAGRVRFQPSSTTMAARPGCRTKQVFDALGPLIATRGWVFLRHSADDRASAPRLAPISARRLMTIDGEPSG